MLRLGHIVIDLKKENEELQARVIPSTPIEMITEHGSRIDTMTIHMEKIKKFANSIAKAITKYWTNIVQDEQLQQLGA